MRPSKTLLAAAAIAAVFYGESDRAFAASIGLNGTTLIFTADAGADVVTASTPVATDVLLTFSSPLTILTPVCVPSGGGVSCALAGIDLLAILGGSGDDVLTAQNVTNHLNVFLSGGGGGDVLIGGNGNDILKGGLDDDVMFGGDGADLCFSGGGNDLFFDCPLGNVEPPDPTLETTAVPEPATLALVASGAAAVVANRRRRRAAAGLTAG